MMDKTVIKNTAHSYAKGIPVGIRQFLIVMLSSLFVFTGTVMPKERTYSPNNGTDIKQWVQERVKNAKSKKPELVRFPIVGCMPSATCPTFWTIGFIPEDPNQEYNSPELDEGSILLEGFWKEPAECSGDECGPAAWGPTILIEGTFTGLVREVRDNEGFAGEGNMAPVFNVLRSSGQNLTPENRLLRVMLTAEQMQKAASPFRDDKPWLVLVSGKSNSQPESFEISNEIKVKLLAAGFKDAEVFDSTRAKKLFCCYPVVVAGRYRSLNEARAILDQLIKKDFSGYIKQGW